MVSWSATSSPSPPPPSPSSSALSANMMFADGDKNMSTIHPDILQTHILTRLDGTTLAATGCASSDLRALATDQKLWQKICISTWPSINDPLLSQVISTFPSGYRSFFSDSYPVIHHSYRSGRSGDLDRPFPTTSGLISAVDIYYKEVPIMSKVVETETGTPWFQCTPFRVDLLEPKEFVPTCIQHAGGKDTWLKELEENVTLSWILIDPKKKRAMNLSSQRPVLAQRHWLTGEAQLKFAVVMAGYNGGWWGTEKEYVECGMIVTCGGKEGGDQIHVREVCMAMEDMEGRGLSGKDSLVILEGAMERGERRKRGKGTEGRETFQEFVRRKTQWRVMKQSKEKMLDMACIIVGITVFLAFWSSILLRR